MTPKQSAVRFFFQHAGYSYDPAKESKLSGRWRCARNLARAEAYAKENDWQYQWEEDWNVESHVREFGEEAYPSEPSTCEYYRLVDADGVFLDSLGCIDDADANYRRVIEAELASEALARIEATLEREATSAGDVPFASEVR